MVGSLHNFDAELRYGNKPGIDARPSELPVSLRDSLIVTVEQPALIRLSMLEHVLGLVRSGRRGMVSSL